MGLLHEMIPAHHVEGVLEVDLKQAHLGTLVLFQSVAKRVSYYFHATLAAYAVVFPRKSLADLFLGSEAKALCHQAADGVTARQRSNRRLRLLQCNRNAACHQRSQELWALAMCEVVASTRECAPEVVGLCAGSLLEKRRLNSEQTSSRSRPEGAQRRPHQVVRETRNVLARDRRKRLRRRAGGV